MKTALTAVLFSSLIGLGGCYAEEGVAVRGTATVETPDLVEVEPGVQVIAEYDEPIFYSDGWYWRTEGGVWYRSHDYHRGWSHVRSVPTHISRIDHPERYRHVHSRRGNVHARR